MTTKICSIDGCDRRAVTALHCSMHYSRLRRTGSVGSAKPKILVNVTGCRVDGCDGGHQAKGYCGTHYSRLMRTGSVADRPKGPEGCLVDGCEIKHGSGGYCNKHYRRLLEHGDPNQIAYIEDISDRFDSYVELIPFSTCHYWIGGQAGRYGCFRANGKHISSHRYAYERAKGPIPDGLMIRHSCHTPRCVNPDHLSVGTHADNSKDKVDAGRQARGSKHPNSKLNESDVRIIRLGVGSSRSVAARFGVNEATISDVRRRKSWRHVP